MTTIQIAHEAPAASNPTPADIRQARESAGISQTAAAALVHSTCRVWQQWEAGDRKMHAAFWELFTLKMAAHAKIVRDLSPVWPASKYGQGVVISPRKICQTMP